MEWGSTVPNFATQEAFRFLLGFPALQKVLALFCNPAVQARVGRRAIVSLERGEQPALKVNVRLQHVVHHSDHVLDRIVEL